MNLKDIVDFYDRERLIVSHDIHDGIVQDIVAAKMFLERAIHDLPAEETESLTVANALLEKALREGRRLSSDLRPLRIAGHEFASNLEALAREIQQTFGVGVHHDLRLSPNGLSDTSASLVYAMLKECLMNVVRHSQVKRAELRVEQSPQRLLIEVRDRGVGFDPATVPEDRLGLRGIRERAQMLGGAATVFSRPGEGTRVAIDLPADEDDKVTR